MKTICYILLTCIIISVTSCRRNQYYDCTCYHLTFSNDVDTIILKAKGKDITEAREECENMGIRISQDAPDINELFCNTNW